MKKLFKEYTDLIEAWDEIDSDSLDDEEGTDTHNSTKVNEILALRRNIPRNHRINGFRYSAALSSTREDRVILYWLSRELDMYIIIMYVLQDNGGITRVVTASDNKNEYKDKNYNQYETIISSDALNAIESPFIDLMFGVMNVITSTVIENYNKHIAK